MQPVDDVGSLAYSVFRFASFGRTCSTFMGIGRLTYLGVLRGLNVGVLRGTGHQTSLKADLIRPESRYPVRGE